jgi:hypothetical protein
VWRPRSAGLILAGSLLLAACGGAGLGAGDSEDGGGAGGTGSDASAFSVAQVESTPQEDVPSALDDRENDDFPEPLLEPSLIVSGGPPPDGIPAIDEPTFLEVGDVDFLADEEPVLVLDVGGETRAYPVQIMTWHELVNDTIGEVPVTVSYCPLCNSAVAYDRRLGDRVLDFGTSGSLYQSSMVMYDRQTETLWTHFDGEAVVGWLAGEQLDLIPMATVAWADFREAHPDGIVLSRDTGFSRSYGQNPYVGYEESESPIAGFITTDIDDREAAKARVIGVRDGDESVAIRQADLNGRSLTAWLLPGTASALDGSSVADGQDVGATGVFVAVSADGRPLTFSLEGERVVDAETGSTWNVFGEAVDGPLVGQRLEPVEHLDTFWFAWATFQPETEVLDP